MGEKIYFVSNDSDVEDGEIALALALAARDLGREVMVVGRAGSPTVASAWEHELPVVEIKPPSRRGYVCTLRCWDVKARNGLLWCVGRSASMATWGRRRRVLHLQEPVQGNSKAAFRFARIGADAILVPSKAVAAQIPQSRVFPNWTSPASISREPPGRIPATLGFFGKPSTAKGILVLSEAVHRINQRTTDRVRLLIAGESQSGSGKESGSHKQRDGVNVVLKSLGTTVISDPEMSIESFLAEVDLLVFPPLGDEPLGVLVQLAMAARVPFVISDVGSLPEIAGKLHPWVVSAGDSEALATAIEMALADWSVDPVERAFERWQSSFSPEAGRRRLDALLCDLGV